MDIMIQVLFCYLMQDIFEDYSTDRTKRGMA